MADEVGGKDDRVIAQEVMKLEQEARGLLSGGNAQKALSKACAMPIGKDEASKNAGALVFAEIANQVKDAEIPKYLDSLSQDERQNCMKWVYRAMATGKNSVALLKWQSAIVDKDGNGSIMRVLTDRKM